MRTQAKTLWQSPLWTIGGTLTELAEDALREGYCVDMGVAYYCSKDCLHTDFTDEEWNEECENNDQSYYTEW